jgi:hypothetical protein
MAYQARGSGFTGARYIEVPSLKPPAPPPIVETAAEEPKRRKSLKEILQEKKPHRTYPLVDT